MKKNKKRIRRTNEEIAGRKRLTGKILKKEIKKKNGGKRYFNKDTEQSIISFQRCKRPDYRNNIFIKEILPAFQQLIDQQIKVYKIHRINPDVDSVKRETLDYMFMKLSNNGFTPGVCNAFSYFNVVCRNHFFELYSKQMKANEFSLPIEHLGYKSEITKAEDYRLFRGYNESVEDKIVNNDSINDFMIKLKETKNEIKPMLENECIKKYRDNIDSMTEKYLKVIDGLCELFNDSDKLPSLKKKSIYFFLKEMTGVDSRIITEVFDFLRTKYSFLSGAFEI